MIRTGNYSMQNCKQALEQAVEGFPNLAEEESRENIKNNSVIISKIKDGKANYGCGLLLTTDGFIITAYHNVANYQTEWDQLCNEQPEPVTQNWIESVTETFGVTTINGERYAIDPSFCMYHEPTDIVLMKAVFPFEPEPVKFRTLNRRLEPGDNLEMLSAFNNQSKKTKGKIRGKDIKFKGPNIEIIKTYISDLHTIKGMSGSPVITSDGEFSGIINYSSLMNDEDYTGGTEFLTIQKFVRLITGTF